MLLCIARLMVIDDFRAMSAILKPRETYPPLVVNADAVLSLSVVLQRLKTISWRHSQAVQLCCGMQLKKLSTRNSLGVFEPVGILAVE